MRRNGGGEWFATRTVQGRGDDGATDVITLWIERKPGALWAVGRAIDLAERPDGAIHRDDYVFEGYEMADALAAANEALAADLEVSRSEGRVQLVKPFAESELLAPLERWFFGHAPRPPAGRGSSQPQL
jgi:hypothetical protein